MNISGPLSPSASSFRSQKSPALTQASPRVLSPRSPDSQWSTFSDKMTSRVPPLTRLLLNGQLAQEYQAPLNGRQRLVKWMVDRGKRILWLTSFWLVHLIIFAGAVYMYQTKVRANDAQSLLRVNDG